MKINSEHILTIRDKIEDKEITFNPYFTMRDCSLGYIIFLIYLHLCWYFKNILQHKAVTFEVKILI